MDKNVITVNQFAVLLWLYLIGSSLIYLPALNAGRNGWVAVALSSVVGLYILYVLLYLNKLYPGKNIIGISQLLLGKFWGNILSVIFLTSVFFVATLRLYELSIVILLIFPLIPYLFVLTVITLSAAYTSYKGLTIVGRLGEVLLIPVIFLLFISYVAALTINILDFGNLRPFLNDIRPLISGFVYSANWPYAELVILGIFLPFIKDIQNNSKIIYLWFGFAVITLVTRSFIAFAVIGVETANLLLRFPFLEVYRLIDFAGIERIDMFFFFFWFVTGFFTILITYQALTKGFKEVFSLKDYKFLIVPFGLLLVIMTFIFHNNDPVFLSLHIPTVIFYNLPISVLFPTILMILAIIKNKKTASKNQITSSGV